MFASSINSRAINTIFYFAVFSIYGISFITVDRISSKDGDADKFSKKLFYTKHPELDLAKPEQAHASDDAER